MAGNTITNIMPKILAAGLLVLREQAVMPRLVNRDYGDEAAQKGTTIDIPISKPQTAVSVTPSPNYASAQGNAPSFVQVPLDQWKHTDFFLTDKEMVEIDRNRHFLPGQTLEAIKALANAMDLHIHAQYRGIYGFVGTAGVTPYSTVATDPNARKVLNNQLAPLGSRRIVMNPDAEAQALQLAAFSNLEQTGDSGVKIEGEIGRKFGFDHYMSQNVVTHVAGTVNALKLINSTYLVGASSIKAQLVSGAGNLKTGDIFTIAGDTQTYVFTGATASITSAGVTLTIDPPLKRAPAALAAMTKKASHVVNVAFVPEAYAFATRPLMRDTADLAGGHPMMSAVDPMTGLSLRLEIIRQNKQNAWDFDVLWGSKLVRPALATRIAG